MACTGMEQHSSVQLAQQVACLLQEGIRGQPKPEEYPQEDWTCPVPTKQHKLPPPPPRRISSRSREVSGKWLIATSSKLAGQTPACHTLFFLYHEHECTYLAANGADAVCQQQLRKFVAFYR
jgi:hypothetical protein